MRYLITIKKCLWKIDILALRKVLVIFPSDIFFHKYLLKLMFIHSWLWTNIPNQVDNKDNENVLILISETGY